jgi:hypothetical protein
MVTALDNATGPSSFHRCGEIWPPGSALREWPPSAEFAPQQIESLRREPLRAKAVPHKSKSGAKIIALAPLRQTQCQF